MRKFKYLSFAAVLALLALAGFACSELDESAMVAPPAPVDYAGNVKAILDIQCAGCHGGTEPAGMYDLSEFIGVFGRGTDSEPNVIPGSSSSLLIASIESGGTMAEYIGSQNNLTTLRNWIVVDKLGFRNMEAHPDGWINPASTASHGAYLAADGYDMTTCKGCHGDDFAGGITGSSCISCHESTPLACNTCHGQSFRPDGSPPADVAGNVETTASGVGAHQIHLSGGKYGRPLVCSECHTVPADLAHINSNTEIVWGDFATSGGAVPVYNSDNTCANVYCHGNFSSGNKDNMPKWNDFGQGRAVCGTCHNIPPTGPSRNFNFVHSASDVRCSMCHGSVINSDFTFADRTKHQNGMVDR